MYISKRKFCLGALSATAVGMPATLVAQEVYPTHKDSAKIRFEKSAVAAKSGMLDPEIQRYVNQVSVRNLLENVNHLQDFGTRNSYSAGIERVADWIESTFQNSSAGTVSISRQAFNLGESGPERHNILSFKRGKKDGYIVICAHYDSRSSGDANLPQADAPGADDNASGLAVLLEVSRITSAISLDRGVMLAAFCGEEQGLLGSSACARIAQAERWAIDLVINLDMVGFQAKSGSQHIVIEYDHGNASSVNDAASRSFAIQTALLASQYTSLSVEHSDIYASDYMPFEAAGYPCIGLFDKGDMAPFYHTESDRIDVVSGEQIAEVAKLIVASVIAICEQAENTGGISDAK